MSPIPTVEVEPRRQEAPQQPTLELDVVTPADGDAEAANLRQPEKTASDSHYLAAALICCALFLGAFVLFVLYPAIQTLFGL